MPGWASVTLIATVAPTSFGIFALLFKSGRTLGTIEQQLKDQAEWQRNHDASHITYFEGLRPRPVRRRKHQ